MFIKAAITLLVAASTVFAAEVLPVLKINDEIYTNVTVTEVTATDIYFTSPRGMGNAKLKNLTPELQKHFHYDAARSAQTEQARSQANVEFQKNIAQNKAKPSKTPTAAKQPSPPPNDDDFVAPKLHARSVRGKPAPEFVVEEWLSQRPFTTGKFVLIDFWATWCGPCRASIPEINGFYAKYSDRLCVIGVSDESASDVRAMKSPKINYAIAVDTKQRMMRELEITGIPHCILIDPAGIVRYEGMPQYLDDQKLEHFLNKYSK